MRLSPRNIHVIAAVLLLGWIDDVFAKKKTYQCPIGFQIAFTNDGTPICYRLKEPEAFSDKFKDCTGNLYSSKLYHSLNFTKSKQVLWTEYKSLYPGGPFIDWSYTESTGDILLTTYDVNYDSSLGIDEELCVLIDPVSNFTAARCDEKHNRYCFVKPYPDPDDMSTKGCKKGSWRFFSPLATCLSAVTGVGGGPVRATWGQAQQMCRQRGAWLIHRGWRYSNNPVLHKSGSLPYYPMGIVMLVDNNTQELEYTEDNAAVISRTEWNFQDAVEAVPETMYGAIRNDFWRLVNSSFIFFDVVCEQPFSLKVINLNLTVDDDNNVLLRVNDTIKKNEIHCFTDSLIYYPSEVSVSKLDDNDNTFQVFPASDGYYWCIEMDHKNFYPTESDKALFIRSKESVVNLYACKIRLKKEYRFENLDKLNRLWKKKLEEYIYYRTKYLAIYGEIPSNGTEEVLKTFKRERPELNWKDSDVIFNLKIRRLYMDARSALVHVMLNPEMVPASPGLWDSVEVVFMKPAYYCRGFEAGVTVPMLELGQSVSTPDCLTYTCVGDFNEGVQWVQTSTDGCTPKLHTTRTLIANIESAVPTWMPVTTDALPGHGRPEDDSSSEESANYTTELALETTSSTEWTITTVNTPSEVSTVETEPPPTTPKPKPPTVSPPVSPTTPTTTAVPTTTLPPEQQLNQVLEDLQHLLQNDTISIDAIDSSFDQVNDILEENFDVPLIPGELLHLLDEIGSRVNLHGDQSAITVRNNVALLVADATPERPVRGIRVATTNSEGFSNNSFGFIESEIDSNHLLANESEAVVHLPASISDSPRRVSFVAFRNERAFHSSSQANSRIVSVNVENLTQFENGEVIDIHLSPLVEDPDRNQTRVCAYWHFTGNDSGYWSQDGCTLIRASTPGTLDTCRCTHLTHFAEILVSRTVFSENNEKALEILTVIGCILSMLGVILIALTATLFRTWRRDYSNKIWLQLSIAIFLLVLCFLVVIYATFDQYNIACMLVGVALHYSVLASFCWMLVAAVLSYRRLVLVFTRDMSHKLLRASAFSWGVPCAIVGILLSVDPQSYQGRFEEISPTGNFCYPSGLGLWLAVYAPIAVMLLANWTLFVLIVRSVFASRRIQRHGDSNEAIRCASVSCLLVFLFGLPWIFGLFASNIVAAYLFTITSSYQGFVLFIFFVLGNKKTRDLWLNKLKIKQTRKVPVTSSTFTNNRSTGPGWRGGPEGTSSIEAKTSKPRSLTSPDDSRFS